MSKYSSRKTSKDNLATIITAIGGTTIIAGGLIVASVLKKPDISIISNVGNYANGKAQQIVVPYGKSSKDVPNAYKNLRIHNGKKEIYVGNDSKGIKETHAKSIGFFKAIDNYLDRKDKETAAQIKKSNEAYNNLCNQQ